MQTVTNGPFVASKVKIGNITHIVSLVLLVAGFVLSLPLGTERFGNEAVLAAYVALIAALLLLNFGRTFTRRWGARFRQDEALKAMLRRLDNRHTLFNYAGPELPDHVLVGPTGLFVIVPKNQGGTIRFDGRQWSRGSVAGTLVRGFTEGGLGNPLADVRRALETLAAYLQKHGSPELIEGLEARPLLVFTNPGAQLVVRNAPVPVVPLRDLWGHFRRAKPILADDKVEELKRVLGREVVQE